MLNNGDRVLAGVSGGPDSVALVHTLHAIGRHYQIEVGIAHLDHGMRPEAAAQEAALVQRLAQRLDVACHLDRIQAPKRVGNLEAQLRERRYVFLEHTATTHGYTKIALGHHAEDNAEAVLMHLLRGSGIRGLAGIPPVRGNRFIRPLIACRRHAILEYLARHDLPYAHDPSNDDVRFERNRIRRQLIPMLQQNYNPGIVPTLNRLAALCFDETIWFSSYLAPLLDEIIVTSETKMTLSVDRLTMHPMPIQRRLIRAALRRWQGDVRRIGAHHIETVIQTLLKGDAGRRLDLPGGLQVQRTTAQLCFVRPDNNLRSPGTVNAQSPFHYQIEKQKNLPYVLEIPEANLRLTFSENNLPSKKQMHKASNRVVWFDMAYLTFPLNIRNWRPGDRLHPFGMLGTQKIKDLFINHKLPRDLRRKVPLIFSAETIIWAVGLRRGHLAPISEKTQRILRIEAQDL